MPSAFSSGAGIIDEMLGYAVPLEVSERRKMLAEERETGERRDM